MSTEYTLEQSLGSAIRYILDLDIPESKAYFDEIPEKLYVPSIYFPVPNIETQKATLRSFRVTSSLDAWFMDRTTWEAEARAASVRDSLLCNNLAIPIITENGEETGGHIRLGELSTRRLENGIVILTVPIREYFYWASDTVKIEHYYMTFNKVKKMIEGRYANVW